MVTFEANRACNLLPVGSDMLPSVKGLFNAKSISPDQNIKLKFLTVTIGCLKF